MRVRVEEADGQPSIFMSCLTQGGLGCVGGGEDVPGLSMTPLALDEKHREQCFHVRDGIDSGVSSRVSVSAGGWGAGRVCGTPGHSERRVTDSNEGVASRDPSEVLPRQAV